MTDMKNKINVNKNQCNLVQYKHFLMAKTFFFLAFSLY